MNLISPHVMYVNKKGANNCYFLLDAGSHIKYIVKAEDKTKCQMANSQISHHPLFMFPSKEKRSLSSRKVVRNV